MANFIVIQEFILKSLPFYKEKYAKFINTRLSHNFQNQKSLNYNVFERKLSSRIDIFTKKNSLNPLTGIGSGTIKKLDRRRGSILKLESIRETLRIHNAQKTEQKEANLLLLKRKTFFNKRKVNTEKGTDDADKESPNSKEKDKNNEGNPLIESIYFQLMKAILEGKTKFFMNFFQKNRKMIDINQVLIEGNTFLILAVREGNYQIVNFLCRENADLNIQNNEGNTALHYAIGKHFYAIADILTKYGAIEDIQNSQGLTAWDCIERKFD